MSGVTVRSGRSRKLAGPVRAQAAVVAGLVAPGVLAGIGLAFASSRHLPRVLPTEDGFYALAVARHIGLGDGITADGVAQTNGFQPLWSFLCAPLYALVAGDRITGLRLTQLLGTLLWLVFAGLLALYARDIARRHGRQGGVAAVVAAVVALGSVSVYRLFHNGLETGLLLVTLCAAVLVLDRTDRWDAVRVVAVGALLAAVAWTRLDGIAFVMAAGLTSGAALAWRTRRAPLAPVLAAGLALASVVPWLLYGLSLDGHLVPSGGRAEAMGIVDAAANARATVSTIGGWILAPAFRPQLRGIHPLNTAVAVAAIAVILAAFAVVVRRRGRLDTGAGTVALWLYAAFLVGYYTFAQGAWWFQDRYLAALLIVAVPWLATAAEALFASRGLVALAGVVAALNLPLFAVLLVAPRSPPAWAAAAANTGTHPNLNWDQASWALRHVQARCRVGARETGTLVYFRPDTVNLDGKVNPAALAAREERRMPGYIDRSGVVVLVDALVFLRGDIGPRRAEWRPPRPVDARYYQSVRRGSERCLR